MHILLRFNLQAGCVQLFILRRHVKVASIRDERDEIHQVSTVSNNIDSIERYTGLLLFLVPNRVLEITL